MTRNHSTAIACELLLLAVCAAICIIQILVPPYIGVADNGDFPKVYRRFSAAPPDGTARNFQYFVSDYEFAPEHLWVSDVQSSENLLAAVPMLLVRGAGAKNFNIRWLGALHMLLFLAGYYTLLLYLRRFGRTIQLVLGAVVLFIFSDVAYVSYFNSFFNDTAAMLGLLLMVALALHLTGRQPARTWTVWLFTMAAVLFITSKTQHALWGVLPAAFLVWKRRLWPAALLVAAEGYMIVTTPPDYSAISLYSVTFFKLAARSAEPEAALRQLGLGPPEYKYIGTYPYMPGVPDTVEWRKDFYHRVGFGKVMLYWLGHPHEAIDVLRGDLEYHHQLRTPLANFRREDGYPPSARSDRFAAWSNLRKAVFDRWPGHIVVWYALVLGGCLAACFRRATRPLAILCLGVCVMAILEFGLASLADGIETDRHLFIFHVLTEVEVCFVAGSIANALAQAWRSLPYRRAPVLVCTPVSEPRL